MQHCLGLVMFMKVFVVALASHVEEYCVEVTRINVLSVVL